METCAGCGVPLAPTWKFCVHCGIAVTEPELPGAVRPDGAATPAHRSRNRALLIGGIGIFIVGIALLVVAIVIFVGTLH
jgi:hypothetical protein